MFSKKKLLSLGAAIGAAALMLTACAQDPGGGGDAPPAGDGEQVTLRVAWWGGDLRTRLTNEVLDAFQADHPNIKVVPQYNDWNGYWDTIATTTAGGDMPDILQMDEKYLGTYTENNSLLDLATLEGLNFDDFDPSALESGRVGDALYGAVIAVNAFAMITNTTLLEAAGIAVPDDTTWTWSEFADLAQQVTDASEAGTWGLQGMGQSDGELNIWARQLGESQWTPDGEMGISEATLTQWWEYVASLKERGSIPPPDVMEEKRAAGQELSGTATNTAAFGMWWSNQYAGLSNSSGDDLALLRPPTQVAGGESGLYYKPSMFWSASAKTEHPAEVALLLDYLLNSTDAGQTLLVERGVPANLAVREHISGLLDEFGTATIDYIDAVSGDTGPAAPLTPEGGSTFEERLQRTNLEVLFDRMSPAEAAAKFIADVDSELAR